MFYQKLSTATSQMNMINRTIKIAVVFTTNIDNSHPRCLINIPYQQFST